MKKIDSFLFFGGDGSFLSNFYNGKGSFFFFINMTFPTAEHAYQYVKARKAGDKKTGLLIKKAQTPKEAKTLSHQITVPFGFADEWNAIRKQVMRDILREKFKNPYLRQLLLDTKGYTLVEATGDKFWGCGLNQDNPVLGDHTKWPGANWLGIILMELRAEIEIEELEKKSLK